MFDELFVIPAFRRKYWTAPMAQQRALYLRHLKGLGACRNTLRNYANDHLSLVRLLDLREGDRVSVPRIEAIATIWASPQGHRYAREDSPKARQRFISRGLRLLRFVGALDQSEPEQHSDWVKVNIFEKQIREERGLSATTVRDYRNAADRFLRRIAAEGIALINVRMTDIDDAISVERSGGKWGRRTVHDYAQRLRAFILFSEEQGWCRVGLAAGIMGPRFVPDEGIPKGLKRADVVRLLASVVGTCPVAKRDRAILLLLIVYGLRSGEVRGLQLDDLDWENSLLHVHCPKPGRIHHLPLSHEVGNAILAYIREGRPSGFGRSLFFTSQAPVQPLSQSAIGKIVRQRVEAIGITSGRRGPHALRHAAAQHLLDEGMSMKVIGDFLGHRDPSSTAIYAKVNLAVLREVAAIDLEGLA